MACARLRVSARAYRLWLDYTSGTRPFTVVLANVSYAYIFAPWFAVKSARRWLYSRLGSRLPYALRAPITCPDHVMTCPILTSARPSPRVLCSEWVVTVGNSQSDLRAHQAVHAWQTTPDTVCPRAYTGIGCANSLGGPFGLDVTAYRTRPLPTGGRRVGSNKVVAVTGVAAMVPKRGPHLTLSLATRQRGVS